MKDAEIVDSAISPVPTVCSFQQQKKIRNLNKVNESSAVADQSHHVPIERSTLTFI